MTGRTVRRYGLITALALVVGAVAWAADPQPPDPSPEARGRMAAIHERMAACLKSDRPFAECRAEMWKDCQEHMGKDGCPMLGPGGGMGPGMGGRRHGPGMMPGAPTAEPPSE
jgi:hypothetical protein